MNDRSIGGYRSVGVFIGATTGRSWHQCCKTGNFKISSVDFKRNGFYIHDRLMKLVIADDGFRALN